MLELPTAVASTPELSEAERELADLRAIALGRLTGHFAHELRNVLTGVRCYLELIGTLELPPEFGRFMGEIQAGLDRMTDLASLWHDVAQSRCSTAHCNSEIQRLLHLLRAAGVAKRMRLEECLDERALGVSAPATTLEPILLALLNDLVERSPEAIRVETLAVNGDVRIRLEAVGCTQDAASGVDPERLSRLLGDPVTQLALVASDRRGYELRLQAEALPYR